MQIKLLSILLMLTMFFGVTAYASSTNQSTQANAANPSSVGKANISIASSSAITFGTQPEQSGETTGIKIKITVDGQVLTATLLDNATARSLVSKFPMTIQMTNAHSIEMVHRFPEPLSANEVQTSGYEVGDLYYWTPRNAFVIYYKQNGGVFENLQKVGHVDSGVEIFEQRKEANVTFELLGK